MRLHSLTVTGFGPFPGTEHVDFTELNDAGLFLLSGPTGAGKTSLLDAVCFALYGTVPGLRGVKSLKCHHAPPADRPEVVLDVSVRGRRFRVRRSPEWTRPKRRGTGTTEQKASASLIELVDGEERLLSSRAQEVGHFLGGLMGMTASQFQQVAMLPQGQFAAFLQATSAERHVVLQQLFGTARFERIEEWMHDHSRRLREAAAEGERSVAHVLGVMADRAGTELPKHLAGEGLATAAADGRVLTWAGDVAAEAAAALDRCRGHAEVARDRHERAHAALAEGQATIELLRRRDAALRELASLEAEASSAEAAAAALDADHRARAALAQVELAEEAAKALRDADRRLAQAAAEVAVRTGPVTASSHPDVAAESDVARWRQREQDARSRLAHLEQLLPRAQAMATVRAELARTEQDAFEARRALAEVEERVAELPLRQEQLSERLADATQLVLRLDTLLAQRDRTLTCRDAAVALPGAETELTRLVDDAREARDAAQAARERHLDLVQRRLDGMAAELAGRLEEGASCPVCGSAVHPSPAAPDGGAVSEDEQEASAADYERLQGRYETASRAASEHQRVVDALRQGTAGLTTEDATEAVHSLDTQIAAARDAQREKEQVTKRLAAVKQELATAAATAQRSRDEVSRLTHAATSLREQLDSLDAELTAALDGQRPDELRHAVRHTTGLVTALGEATAAAAEQAAAVDRFATASARAADVARRHGFPEADQVRGALLPEQHREELSRLLAEREQIRVTATTTLDDPALRGVGEESPPDIAALTAALQDAAQAADEASRALHLAEETHRALADQLLRLEEVLTAWEPARDTSLTADAMARLVRGTGGDNQLQMRLSAYVLATRLDQVVAAANERLTHMRDQRYLLERTGRAHRRNAQAGLGLQVLDEWTGEVRDPSTLSGGETFVVSLALALGLADVVTHEAGGTEVETLFVDEGFGMLDPDTLEDVMDRLDELRAGGRTVGVVSHVSELRDRIPTQVHVEKGRTGSRVALRTLVG